MSDLLQFIHYQSQAVDRLVKAARREGFDEGWAAAMASMKRERQDLGQRLNDCRTSAEMRAELERNVTGAVDGISFKEAVK